MKARPAQAEIDAMAPEDWPSVRRIYAEGISTGQATFETDVPSWEAFDAAHLREARLVAREQKDIVGWAVLSLVSPRPAYSGVAEGTLYVAADARGRGVGSLLLRALVGASERAGIWTVQAAIFPENAASISLLRSNGFREVGRRERIGRLAGAWRDTLLYERRSSVVN